MRELGLSLRSSPCLRRGVSAVQEKVWGTFSGVNGRSPETEEGAEQRRPRRSGAAFFLYFSGISPRGLNLSISSRISPMVSIRIWAALSSR